MIGKSNFWRKFEFCAFESHRGVSGIKSTFRVRFQIECIFTSIFDFTTFPYHYFICYYVWQREKNESMKFFDLREWASSKKKNHCRALTSHKRRQHRFLLIKLVCAGMLVSQKKRDQSTVLVVAWGCGYSYLMILWWIVWLIFDESEIWVAAGRSKRWNNEEKRRHPPWKKKEEIVYGNSTEYSKKNSLIAKKIKLS